MVLRLTGLSGLCVFKGVQRRLNVDQVPRGSLRERVSVVDRPAGSTAGYDVPDAEGVPVLSKAGVLVSKGWHVFIARDTVSSHTFSKFERNV